MKKKTIAITFEEGTLDCIKRIGVKNRSAWLEGLAKEALGLTGGVSMDDRLKALEERIERLEGMESEVVPDPEPEIGTWKTPDWAKDVGLDS